jgi:hypothetical protein
MTLKTCFPVQSICGLSIVEEADLLHITVHHVHADIREGLAIVKVVLVAQ